ncbi:CHAT domain-containing protein, partial [bacterium]
LFTPIRWVVQFFQKDETAGPVQYYEKAIEVLTTAIELNDEDDNPRLEAELAQNLANNFYNLGEYGFPRAYRYYQKRLSIDTTFHQPLEKAIFYSRMGHCALGLDEFEDAERLIKVSILLFENLNQKSLMLQDQGRLAYLYQMHGDYQEAIELYEILANRDSRQNRWEAMIRNYRNIAYNYHLLWEPEDAIQYAEKAEKILDTQHIPKGAPEKSYLRWEFFGLSIPLWGMEEIGASSSEGFSLAEEAALIYILISKNAERLKNFSKALNYEEKRFAIFKNRKDQLAQRISINRIGLLLMKQGRYNEAWDKFLTAYEMSRKAEDLRGRWINVSNLAQVVLIQLSKTGESDHRIACQQLLLNELDHETETGNIKELRGIYGSLGTLIYYEVKVNDRVAPLISIKSTFERLQRLAEADSYFKKALNLSRQEGLWREEAILLKSRAELAACSGDKESAAEMFLQAEHLFEMGGETLYLWRVRYALAGLSSGLSQAQRDSLSLKEPSWYFISAIESLEALPVAEEDSELRLADRSDRWHVYVDAAIAYADADNPEMSFAVHERGRQKRLADVLARRPPKLRRERHKNLWRNLRDVRAQLGEIRRQILALEKDQKHADELEILKEKAKYLQGEFESFMADIQEEDPVLAYLSGASKILTQSLQSTLDAGHGVLSYMIQPQGLTLYTVDRDTVSVFSIPLKIDSLNTLIHQLNESIQQNGDVTFVINQLSHWLLSPLNTWLETRSHLIVIPDGMIWQVPFELLKFNGEPLLDFYTISYAPSLMAYQMAFERRKINQSKVLLVGESWDKSLLDGIPQQTEFLIGANATESQCKNKMASADLVHIERWMLPNEKSPLQAAIIIFSDSESDGYVRPEELFSWDLSASFIKLPVSRLDPAYQSIELYHYALLYAGTPSVMLTRWPQTPEMKSLFFQSYYNELSRLSFSEALAMTEINLRDQSKPINLWASYGLIGFEGMGLNSRLSFARSNLVSTVVQGRNYLQLGDYGDAIGFFEQALIMAESMKDTTSIRGIMVEIIRAGMQGEIWDKAIAYQQRMIELFGSSENAQVAQQNLVTFYYRSGQFEEAAETKQRALEQYRSEKQWQNVAQGAMELAVIYASARNYEASIQWADEAYQTYLSLDNNLGKAKSLIWKGRSLLDSDRYFEARAAFGLAIEILERYDENSQSIHQTFELATAYQLRGICLENISLYQEALEDQNHALSLLESMNRPLQVAQGQQYLANVYWKMGAYRQALIYQEKALKAFENQGQRKHLAMAYSTQGLIQMSLGEIAQAKISEEKAYKLANTIQSREDEATILKNMGQIAIQEQNLDQAYQYFQQAATIDSSLGLRRGLSYDYRNQGMLLIQMRQLGNAILKLKQGLSLAQTVRDLRNQVQCFYGLSLAHMRMGHFKEALAVVDSGLVLIERLVVPELTWRLYRQRGKIEWAVKNRDQALMDFQAAIDIVEKMRAELKVEAFKQGFFDSKMDLYQDTIQLLLEMQQRALAFHYVERAKSRDFIDLLANQRVAIPVTQQDLLEKEKILKIQIQEAQNQIAQNLGEIVWDEHEIWNDSLQTLRDTYESLIVTIQTNNPELASFVSVDPLTAEQIQSELPPGVGLIEYYWGIHAGYCWVITSKEIKL